MKKKRVAFLTLGCKVNSYETDAMQKLFEDAGYEIVAFREEAEVYVINTCTVTNIADRKSRQMLHRAKRQYPQAVIVAVGCYVQTAQKEAAADPAIDILIGNNKKTEIVTIVEDFWKEQKLECSQENKGVSNIYMKDLRSPLQYEDMIIADAGERTRASIKIQDGCNQFCSYCIIPYARGRIRSRFLPDIKKEVLGLAKKGYQEIVLTGIHLSSYGIDFQKETISLLEVIEELSKIKGIERIRLGSLEPTIITEEFVKTLKTYPKFCPHFHLSLQSGCNETLKRMNRHYTSEEYLERCKLLRRYFDKPAITTDIIVGFPGETEEEFKTCQNFLKTVAFSQMHIFPYSKRQGTKAEIMPNQVLEERKKQRSEILLALERKMRHNYQELFMGNKEEILLEEKIQVNGNSYWVGHNERYLRIAVPVWNQKNASNQFVMGKIIGRLNENLLLAKFCNYDK